MKCSKFEPLIIDMKSKNIEKEHYHFNFNNFRFDVILSIANIGYEILVAIHDSNWGCVLKMNSSFFVEVPDDAYFKLCKVLQLNWNKDHFSSAVFLQLLSDNSPRKSNCQGVDYKELIAYLPYRHVDEESKIYFCGWNDHQRDNKNARNFDKTEFYFGKSVADYCRKNNISSMWSDIPREEKIVTKPWDKD